jgi:hypothetical protein
MAIYPIINGQKHNQQNVIPPHSPSAKPAQPAVAQPAQNNIDDNLIDFDDTPAPVKTEQSLPTEQAPRESEIQGMLNSTGKPADGPLLDFTSDMKKDLPSTTQQ